MTAYYNENEPYAAQTLRNLIDAGHIAPGIVDERSIEDVYPSDLRGFTQCHFFAGIGVWSYALRRAGWSDDRPVWTGSCPCQPFSAAGAGAGFADERHLWPALHHLIAQCRPECVIGEQVASKDAEPWIDLVQDDMEALGYPFGAIPFPSAGVGAPHIRDRIYWVADADHAGPQGRRRVQERATKRLAGSGGMAGRLADSRCDRQYQQCGGLREEEGSRVRRNQSDNSGDPGGVADPERDVCGRQAAATDHVGPQADRSANQSCGCGGSSSGMADAQGSGRGEERPHLGGLSLGDSPQGLAAGLGNGGCDSVACAVNGFWRAADWLLCRDGKWRPIEPGTFPLAHGAPARVGRLRAYGNGLCAPAAEAFIQSVMEAA